MKSTTGLLTQPVRHPPAGVWYPTVWAAFGQGQLVRTRAGASTSVGTMAQFAMSRQSMLWACILASMGGGAAAVAQGSMSLARPGPADAIAASFRSPLLPRCRLRSANTHQQCDCIDSYAAAGRSATLRLRGGSPTEEVMTYPSFVKDKNDFNHVIRIFNTNLPGGRTVLYSLIGIKGVGRRFGDAVIKRSGIDGTKRMGECTAEEVEKLVQVRHCLSYAFHTTAQ